MSRPLRILLSGATYHVTSRGNAQQSIFADNEDRDRFLNLLSIVKRRYLFEIYAFCLMGNHYHLLISTKKPNLSEGMQYLNSVYSQGFNARHRRCGHVMQGRFKAFLINERDYLAEVARYIDLNPVRAHLASDPSEWNYSSFNATAGLAPAPRFLSSIPLLSLFSEDDGEARSLYRAFVMEGVGLPSPLKSAKGGWLMAKEEQLLFIGELLEEMSDNEVPLNQLKAVRPSLEEVFEKQDRDSGIAEAIGTWGYRLREVGDHLGLHYSRISHIYNDSRSKIIDVL